MIGRQMEKLERLYLTYLDKIGIADTMRRNLASDIVNGRYGLRSVTTQMVEIEKYESTVVSNATREYEMYLDTLVDTEQEKWKLRMTLQKKFCSK